MRGCRAGGGLPHPECVERRAGKRPLSFLAFRPAGANPCFLAHLLFYAGPRLKPSGYAKLFAPGPSLDRFVDACREARTRDDVERSAADAERVLVDDAFIVIPLAATRRVWGVSTRVDGFVPHPSILSQRWEHVALR